MDDSDLIKLLKEQVTTLQTSNAEKDNIIATLQTENTDIKAQNQKLLETLQTKSIITKSEADIIKASKG